MACDQLLGWKYEHAFERPEKYKEGKVILEKMQLIELEPCPSVVTYRGVSTRPAGLSEMQRSPSSAPFFVSLRRTTNVSDEDSEALLSAHRRPSPDSSSPASNTPIALGLNMLSSPLSDRQDILHTSSEDIEASPSAIARSLPWANISADDLMPARR